MSLLRRYGVGKSAFLALIVAVLVLIAVLVLMQAKAPVQQPQKGITLRVITRHGYDILDVAKSEFLASDYAKKYNIVNVEWLSIDPGEWVDVIKASASKPGQEIDVAWGGGPTLFDLLVKEGLLRPIDSNLVISVSKEIPDELSGAIMKRTADGKLLWVAAAISSFGFTVNTNYLQKAGLPMPDKWIDLANETFAKTLPIPSVGTADASVSTSNTRMFEIILQDYGWVKGWQILTLLGANARIYDESGLVRDAVIRGDVGVGTTIDFYGYTAQLEKPEFCRYIVPSDGSIVNGDPIALLSTTKNPEAAQAFIAWVLSTEGQKIWLDPRVNRMPANPRVFDTPEGKKREDLRIAYENTMKVLAINFSDEVASSYEQSLIWFFYSTITAVHDKLQNTWEKLAKAKLDGKISESEFLRLVEMMTDPTKLSFKDPKTGKVETFTESYAKSINEALFTDVDYRKSLIEAWKKAATARYDMILEELKKLG